MSEVEFEFKVGMTCDGCKGAVSRILGKIPQVSSFEADVEAQRVTVKGTSGQLDPDLVLDKLSKWGTAAGKHVERLK